MKNNLAIWSHCYYGRMDMFGQPSKYTFILLPHTPCIDQGGRIALAAKCLNQQFRAALVQWICLRLPTGVRIPRTQSTLVHVKKN